MLNIVTFIKLIYFVISLNNISCSCVTTYITRCDTLTDVINNEDSNSRVLIVETNCDNVPCSINGENDAILDNRVFNKTANIRELFINNQISGIEENAFSYLKEVVSINLFNNKIRKIKARIFSSLKLIDLNLTKNGVEEIEKGSFANSDIKVLDLSLNKLKFIGNDIFNNIRRLKTLILKNNEIEWIDKKAFSDHTEILDLSFNKLTDLNANVFDNLSNLKMLRLKDCKINGIVHIPALKNIEIIDLSNNNLRITGEGIFNYPKLQELYLQNNKLIVINPNSFMKSSVIRRLFLHGNHLYFLPGEIGDLFSNLKEVTIGANPWSCACLSVIQNYVRANQIKLLGCDEKYFGAGNFPICFVVDDENQCSVNDSYKIVENNIDQVNKLIENYVC